ncbi:hypothetical protein HRbin36_02873 [bacterium HR36]|nr:hypothetical protein HRbin36_02873 [bacterium HR36]
MVGPTRENDFFDTKPFPPQLAYYFRAQRCLGGKTSQTSEKCGTQPFLALANLFRRLHFFDFLTPRFKVFATG